MDVRVRRVRRSDCADLRVGPIRTIRLAFRRIASACAPCWLGPPTQQECAQLQPPLFWRQALAAVAMVRFSLLDHLM